MNRILAIIFALGLAGCATGAATTSASGVGSVIAPPYSTIIAGAATAGSACWYSDDCRCQIFGVDCGSVGSVDPVRPDPAATPTPTPTTEPTPTVAPTPVPSFGSDFGGKMLAMFEPNRHFGPREKFSVGVAPGNREMLVSATFTGADSTVSPIKVDAPLIYFVWGDAGDGKSPEHNATLGVYREEPNEEGRLSLPVQKWNMGDCKRCERGGGAPAVHLVTTETYTATCLFGVSQVTCAITGAGGEIVKMSAPAFGSWEHGGQLHVGPGVIHSAPLPGGMTIKSVSVRGK